MTGKILAGCPQPGQPTTSRENPPTMSIGRTRVNFAETIVPRLDYQGTARYLSLRIRDFMVTGGFAVV